VIRFSAGLVVVALGVLIGGVVTSKLSLVYVSIAVSVLALIVWAIGVFLKRGELREELFGGRPELVPAGAGAGAGLSAPGRSASAAQSPAPSPVTPVPSAGQDHSAYGQREDGFNAAAFPSGSQVRPSWAPGDPAPQPAADRVAAPVGGWGSTSTPPAVTSPVAPRAWGSVKEPPAPPPVSVGTGTGKTPSADAGSDGALRSWFDRPAQAKAPVPKPADTVATPAMAATPDPATTLDPAAGKTAAPAGKDAAPAGKDEDTLSVSDTSGDEDVPAVDEDDDWPTRYSWLDDEESDEAVETDDVPLESDDAVAAEVEASDLPKPTSAGVSKHAAAKSAAAKSDAEEAAAERADDEKAEAAESAASPAAHLGLEGTDAADEAPLLPSVTDLDPAETAEAEPSAEAEPTAEDDKPSAEDEPSGAKQESGTKMVTVVPGVPRYHEPDCILIRFMPEGDVQSKSIPEAKAAKCTPCAACQPED
jgi:hypothetical protein